MKIIFLILTFYIGLSLIGQSIPKDTLVKLFLSGEYQDSTIKLIKNCTKKEKEKLFLEIRTKMNNGEFKKENIQFFICYFEFYPSNENIFFLFENIHLSSGIDLSLSQCSFYDVLGKMGRIVPKIAKEKAIEAKSYREFYQMNLLVFKSNNWGLKRKEKYLRRLQKHHPELEDYVTRTINGEI